MHRTITILALLLISSATHAQNTLSSQANTLRQDCVGKEVIDFLEPGCSGENVRWDFSDIESQNVKRNYMQIYDLSDRLLWDESGSLVTYQPSADSVLISRIETPIYEMSYSLPIVSMVFPLAYGRTITSPFAGTGSYEGKVGLTEVGTNVVTADATGTLILAEGDTLRNVLRVSTLRSADVTIANTEDTKDIFVLQKTTDITEWYARGYRYPVLKSVEERICREGSLLRTVKYSHRITPQEMALLEDPVNEDIRTADSIAYAAANPLRNVVVTNNGSSASVSYDLETDAHVSMTLANAQGMVYWRSESDETAGNSYQHEVPLSGLRRGQYVIYVNANGTVYSNKVNVE